MDDYHSIGLSRVFEGCHRLSRCRAPWSPEFMSAYEAALNNAAIATIGIKRSVPGSVAEAIARYLDSTTGFTSLAPSTQAKRRAILNRFRDQHGDKRLPMLQPEHVARILSRQRPHAQRNTLKTLRGLMAFAVMEGLLDGDPTGSVKVQKIKDSGGFATWSPEQIEKYRQHYPLGTMARLALELGIGTIQRRGDAIELGRQHIRNGILSLTQKKTKTPVDIPVLPELQTAIDAMGKAGSLTFLMTELGKPFTATGFSNKFRDWCNQAGVQKNLSFHGLRKTGATRFAEAGFTDHEIMAWGGWTSIREVQRYTRAANRKSIAIAAAKKLKHLPNKND